MLHVAKVDEYPNYIHVTRYIKAVESLEAHSEYHYNLGLFMGRHA